MEEGKDGKARVMYASFQRHHLGEGNGGTQKEKRRNEGPEADRGGRYRAGKEEEAREAKMKAAVRERTSSMYVGRPTGREARKIRR